MRKIILMLFIVLFCMVNSFAQEKPRQKEVGLLLSSLNSFGLTYRMGSPKALWRFNSLLMSGTDNTREQDSLINNSSNFSINFRVGREWRRGIAEDLEIRFGSDFSLGYSKSKSRSEDGIQNASSFESNNSNYGINIVFGFNYLVGANIIIGAEILPGINYSRGKSTSTSGGIAGPQDFESENSGFSYGFSSNSALLSFVYKF